MIESERALAAAYQRLAADATFVGMLAANGPQGIHEQVAPAGTATPFVVVDVPSGVDLVPIGGGRVWQDTLVTVTVRGAGFARPLVPIADRADELLEGYAVVIDGVEVGRFRRQRGFRLPPEVDRNGARYPAFYQEYRVEAARA